MNIQDRTTLVNGLRLVQKALCGYSSTFCDCKYGAGNVGSLRYEDNGCPEVRAAAVLLGAMTDSEYADLMVRANYPRPLPFPDGTVFESEEEG